MNPLSISNSSWRLLLDRIRADAPAHASIPFWSWNDLLCRDELLHQMEDMKRLGMRGFFMHARGGLKTEYMSDAWFDAIRFCIQKGEELGLEAWAYDENGWPSGFAGGELLRDPENFASYIRPERLPSFPSSLKGIIGVYVMTDRSVTRVTEDCGASEYLVIRRLTDFSYVNVLSPAIAKQFLAKTHARYLRELGSDMSKKMPGFFTDEPQYYRYGTPWSDEFLSLFPDRYGYDVRDRLPAMFYDVEDAEEFRYDYYLLCHECFYQNFLAPIYRWCDEHGMMLTGHGIEEWSLAGQMMCCGGVMPFYACEHIPGIDYLGRGIKDAGGVRQIGSVCAQLGKKTALSEMFACCGWDVTPRELKRIADLQFCYGVNMICEHLYAYSGRGSRKNDYPNHYSEHSPWHDDYLHFENHYKHLGAALSQGEEIADVLVIHPIRSAYLHYKRESHPTCIADMDARFASFVNDFAFRQIPYHFADEGLLAQMGRLEGASIRVGLCRYRAVVLPHCQTLASSTVALLYEYMKNGGKIYILGDAPTRMDGQLTDLSFLHSTVSDDELRAISGIRLAKDGQDVPLHMQVRKTDAGRMLFIANTSAHRYDNVEITVSNARGFSLLDPQSMTLHPLRGKRNADGSVTLLYHFDDSASCLLLETDAPMEEFRYEASPSYLPLPAFTLSHLPENILLLDYAALSLDGAPFGEECPIVQIADNLLQARYAGTVALRYRFSASTLPSSLLFVCEPITDLRIEINGQETQPCAGYRIDRRFLTVDARPYTVIGENFVTIRFPYAQREQVYEVLYGGGSETLRNCLHFDTEITASYLFGDFGVTSQTPFIPAEKNTLRTEGGFVLTERDLQVDLSNPVVGGYPFFAGRMRAWATLIYRQGDPTVIHLGGHYATCRAWINGVDLGTAIFTDEFRLAPHLREGENLLEVEFCCSNRNLLGPHHRKDPEPYGVSPKTFSYESQWKGAECPAFLPSYAFVRFGIGF